MEDLILDWWICDSWSNHPGQVGLLNMGFPRVFILLRDHSAMMAETLPQFKEKVVGSVSFFNPEDRNTSSTDKILRSAWEYMRKEHDAESELVDKHLTDKGKEII